MLKEVTRTKFGKEMGTENVRLKLKRLLDWYRSFWCKVLYF